MPEFYEVAALAAKLADYYNFDMGEHPSKEIDAAIDYAVGRGWRLIKAGPRAHIWGTLYCHQSDRQGCRFRVYCTPRNPQNHSKDIRRHVNACPH